VYYQENKGKKEGENASTSKEDAHPSTSRKNSAPQLLNSSPEMDPIPSGAHKLSDVNQLLSRKPPVMPRSGSQNALHNLAGMKQALPHQDSQDEFQLDLNVDMDAEADAPLPPPIRHMSLHQDQLPAAAPVVSRMPSNPTLTRSEDRPQPKLPQNPHRKTIIVPKDTDWKVVKKAIDQNFPGSSLAKAASGSTGELRQGGSASNLHKAVTKKDPHSKKEVALVLYDYNAVSDDDITVIAGDVVRVIAV
jgi:hypothetical protein